MAIGGIPAGDDDLAHASLLALLRERGIRAVLISGVSHLDDLRLAPAPHLILLDSFAMTSEELRRCATECSKSGVPVLALVAPDRVAEIDADLGLADFALSTAHASEVVARASLIVGKPAKREQRDLIRVGDLTIDPASYEVSIRGRRVDLRFKEYELLRLLATNPGRVYSREALLSQLWGYDYFGGTRTVDVHVRRLRSKIEDSEHRFIETIWNVGYRFRDLGQPS